MDYNDDGDGVGDGVGVGAGDDDVRGVDPTKEPRQQQSQMKQLSADILSATAQQAQRQQQRAELEPWNARSMSQCHQLAEQFTRDYNKSVVFWPCPRMKVSATDFENSINLLKFEWK